MSNELEGLDRNILGILEQYEKFEESKEDNHLYKILVYCQEVMKELKPVVEYKEEEVSFNDDVVVPF